MQRLFDVDDELFPFDSHWVDVDGVPIHYVDEGQGPVLLMLHGNFMWSFSYRRLIKSLRSDFRCVSIDLAGMGLSAKPQRIDPDFGFTLAEQRQVIENVIVELDLNDITFLSFDHGGAIGFGVLANQLSRFARIIIANSWAWSCDDYRATKWWSRIAPLSTYALRWLMLNQARWLFEAPKDLQDDRVWHACIAPYSKAEDFKPMAVLASQLTHAKPYFAAIGNRFPEIAKLPINIVWATKHGGLFPEFVEEGAFLARWRDIFPDAPVTLLADSNYYPMVTRPSDQFLDLIRG